MPTQFNIVPIEGVQRFPNAGMEQRGTPFDLYNCRVKYNRVRPNREGDLLGQICGEKPWFKFQDNILTGCDLDPACGTSDNFSTGDNWNGVFYGTKCCGEPNCGRISILPDQYPAAGSEERGIPLITDVGQGGLVGWRRVPREELGIEAEKYVSYIFVPRDKYGNAGNFYWHWFLSENTSGNLKDQPIFEVTANQWTDSIDVFRTPELDPDTGKPWTNEGCQLREYFYVDTITLAACEADETECQDGPAGQDLVKNAILPPIEVWDWNTSQISTNQRVYVAAPVPNENYYRAELVTPKLPGSAIDPPDPPYDVPTVAPGFPVLNKGVDTYLGVDYHYFEIEVPPGPGGNQYFRDIADTTEVSEWRFYRCDPIGGSTSLDIGFNWSDQADIRYKENDDGDIIIENSTSGLTRQNATKFNVHSLTTDNEYSGFCAKASKVSGGRMMWGGVSFGTALPQPSYVKEDVNDGETVRFRLEYLDGKGNTIYGPALELNDVNLAVFDHQFGAVALNIFVDKDNDGTYNLLERIPVFDPYASANDESITNFFKGTCASQDCITYSFNDDIDQAQLGDAEDTIIDGKIADCIQDLNKIYISEFGHPAEVTFAETRVASDEEIRHIAHARLDESEQQASYRFYVATDKAIYYGDQSGTSVQLDQITERLGVATGADGQALWAETHYGGAFMGTDGHLWYITGRDMIDLDRGFIETPGREGWYLDLYQEVYDIEYHTRWREVALATNTGLWMYDMGGLRPQNRRGIVSHYNFPTINPTRLFYDRDDNTGLGTGAGFAETLGNLIAADDNDSVLLVDNGLYLEDPRFKTTQFDLGDSRIKVDMIEVDFDPMPTNRDPVAPNNPAYMTVTIGDSDNINYITTQPNATAINQQVIGEVEPRASRFPRFSSTKMSFEFENFEELRLTTVRTSGQPKLA